MDWVSKLCYDFKVQILLSKVNFDDFYGENLTAFFPSTLFMQVSLNLCSVHFNFHAALQYFGASILFPRMHFLLSSCSIFR